jgi:hypothetical protein
MAQLRKHIAYEYGMVLIENSVRLVGKCLHSSVEELSREQAHHEIDNLELARSNLLQIAGMFSHYKVVESVAYNMATTIHYTYAYLAPVFMLSHKDAIKEQSKTFTYLIKNPLTGLIKIGKSNDVKTRISNLECGSGASLKVLAIIEGDIERYLHKKFSNCHAYKEWFRDDNRVISKFAKEQ